VSDQVVNAILAIFAGLILAGVLFVPFAVLSYRRRGGMTVARTLTWAGGLVYFFAIWTFTLVPFPDPAAIQCQSRNTHLGRFLGDIAKFDHGSPLALVHNPAFLQFAYNVVLFVPLGFVLRLLWRKGVVFTTAVGACLTLFIETTQLTGVWWLYPCAYRVFDVDDLLANTSGALIGGLLSYPLARLVRADQAPRHATVVTLGRRLTGMVCDLIVPGLAYFVTAMGVQVLRDAAGADLGAPLPGWFRPLAWGLPFLALLALALKTGRTPGDWAVGIEFRRPDGTSPTGTRLARYLGGIGGYLVLGGAAGTTSGSGDAAGDCGAGWAVAARGASAASRQKRKRANRVIRAGEVARRCRRRKRR